MKTSLFVRIAMVATVLALCVVMLGAYVRLSNAGLGCPDWPGCYGRLVVPSADHSVNQANQAYPDRPVEAHKAWKEMIHRYFAGTLGLMIFALSWLAWRHRRYPGQQMGTTWLLAGLVIFQALLGMWTVTLLLKPLIVMGHLLGGMATLSLLWWLTLRQGRFFVARSDSRPVLDGLAPLALTGLVILGVQIALGGWTSANYAALHCPDFPTCQGQWWPPMDFRDAFTLWRGTGIDYEGGVLPNDARVAIHVTHRIGALVTFVYLGWLGIRLWRLTQSPCLHRLGLLMLGLLIAQVSLGIANVVLALPLPVAVAHNGGAALLLLTLVTLNHALRPQRATRAVPIVRTAPLKVWNHAGITEKST